eukprot:NODE_186_length_13589_cov_0.385545.p6 type:complete len:337 gc:universal NODE_186_length_13589_cov_0.385545:1472-2482(+)
MASALPRILAYVNFKVGGIYFKCFKKYFKICPQINWSIHPRVMLLPTLFAFHLICNNQLINLKRDENYKQIDYKMRLSESQLIISFTQSTISILLIHIAGQYAFQIVPDYHGIIQHKSFEIQSIPLKCTIPEIALLDGVTTTVSICSQRAIDKNQQYVDSLVEYTIEQESEDYQVEEKSHLLHILNDSSIKSCHIFVVPVELTATIQASTRIIPNVQLFAKYKKFQISKQLDLYGNIDSVLDLRTIEIYAFIGGYIGNQGIVENAIYIVARLGEYHAVRLEDWIKYAFTLDSINGLVLSGSDNPIGDPFPLFPTKHEIENANSREIYAGRLRSQFQ